MRKFVKLLVSSVSKTLETDFLSSRVLSSFEDVPEFSEQQQLRGREQSRQRGLLEHRPEEARRDKQGLASLMEAQDQAALGQLTRLQGGGGRGQAGGGGHG